MAFHQHRCVSNPKLMRPLLAFLIPFLSIALSDGAAQDMLSALSQIPGQSKNIDLSGLNVRIERERGQRKKKAEFAPPLPQPRPIICVPQPLYGDWGQGSPICLPEQKLMEMENRYYRTLMAPQQLSFADLQRWRDVQVMIIDRNSPIPESQAGNK